MLPWTCSPRAARIAASTSERPSDRVSLLLLPRYLGAMCRRLRRRAALGAGTQLGVQGILVLDARKGGPAHKAGVQGTSRDGDGRLVLGDIITSFNGKAIKCSPPPTTLLPWRPRRPPPPPLPALRPCTLSISLSLLDVLVYLFWDCARCLPAA